LVSLHFRNDGGRVPTLRLGAPHHRWPLLGYLFVKILEQVRQRYGFVVVGFVITPEHIHLLISKPDRGFMKAFMPAPAEEASRNGYRRSSNVRW
jgi:hypothetical protein